MKTLLFFSALLLLPLIGFSQPANDECVNRITISVATGSQTLVGVDLTSATESLDTSCETASNNNLDVWYEFTMPVDGNVRITSAANSEAFTLYDSCGGTELFCFYDDGFYYDLSSGTTYVLRFSERDIFANVSDFNIQAFETAANDECVDRETIVVTTGAQTLVNVDNREATASDPQLLTSCETNASHNYLDTWYEFTMPVNGNVRITSAANSEAFTLYDGCGGAELACFFDDGFYYDLSLGTTYVLRFSERDIFANVSDFNIEAFETAANDECVDREIISVTTGSQTIVNIDNRTATASDPQLLTSCETNASQHFLDVWYEFTMPVDGNVRITSASNSEAFTLYDGCGGAELACFFDDGFYYELSSGTTYVLRFAERSIFAGSSDFNIQAFETAANDECVDREIISVTTGSQTLVNIDNRTATASDPQLLTSCETNASQHFLDVWYEFTMPVDGNVRITSATNSEAFTLYDGCGGAELACFFDDGFYYNLSSGTTYVLRFAERSIFAGSSDFNIQAFETAANDECVDRETISVTTGSQTLVSIDNRTATASDPQLLTSCETNASQHFLDVWYEFTMPVDGNVRITNASNTEAFTLYDGCGGAELACFFDDGFYYNLSSGTTYVLRFAERSIFAGSSDFNIQAFETAANDECNDSLEIPIGVIAPITYSSDFRAASESMDSSCNNSSDINHDVWYEFIMPVNGNVQITNVSNTVNSSLFDVCGGTEISCFYNDGTFFSLAAGTTYTLRLSARDIFSNAFSFDIQAIESALPACTSTTEFIGGSWNNGVPDITKNAIIRSNYNTSTVGLGSITACSCSVDIGTTLTIDTGDYLDVSFDITVDGTLNVNHEGSVVQREATASTINNGNINVHVTTPFLKPRDFMIMGSPMSSETREGVYSGAYRVFNHITGNFVPNADVTAGFPSAENFADDNNDNWALHTGLLNLGEGYLVRPQSSNIDGNTTYDLTYDQGTLNNGDVNFNVLFNTNKNDSPNMLANPYASAIFAGDFINYNSMIDEVYFWEHITFPSTGLPGAYAMNFSMEDISMYNLMGGNKAANDLIGTTKPNGFIAASQGFGIKATAAGTATFSNRMRRVSNNNTLRDLEENKERLWLQVSSSEYELKATTLLGFSEEASSEIDAGYDSRRLATILSIYSHLEDGSHEFGIQSREAFNEEIKIPFGFSTKLDENVLYKISIAEIEGMALNDSEVYLIDHLEQTITNLRNETYLFNADKGTFNNRFTIQFNDREVLGVSNNELNRLVVYPNPASNVLNINASLNSELKEIAIYDLTGRLVETIQVKNNTTNYTIDVSKLASSTYILSVKSINDQQNIRFVID